jgi:hypothetical protein
MRRSEASAQTQRFLSTHIAVCSALAAHVMGRNARSAFAIDRQTAGGCLTSPPPLIVVTRA